MKTLPLFLIILFISCMSFLFAQDITTDIIIGKRLEIYSQVLEEQRPLFISTPAGHDRSDSRYPVLYLLDGNAHFQHATSSTEFLARNGFAPPMIVVAIPNTNRDRDLTPTHMSIRPGSGGGVNFLHFMRKELFPYIDQTYKTEPYRILMGHSLGGMFAIYTLFKHPDMFQAAIAVSPYMAYDKEIVLRQTESMLAKLKELNRFLYITLGNEPGYHSSLEKLKQLFRDQGPEKFRWDYKEMPLDNHMSVPLKSLYFGLDKLYQPWRLPQAVADQGFDSVKKHYKKISDLYGYPINMTENLINMLGYRMLQQQRFQEAINIFEYNVKKYPHSANVYDSLGEGYEAIGKYELARENYQIAVDKSKQSQDRNQRVFLQHLKDIKEKISSEQ